MTDKERKRKFIVGALFVALIHIVAFIAFFKYFTIELLLVVSLILISNLFRSAFYTVQKDLIEQNAHDDQ